MMPMVALILTLLAAPAAALQPLPAALPVGPETAQAAGEATGGEGAARDPLLTEACLAIRHGLVERLGCIGIAAARCMTPAAGGIIADAEGCFAAETGQWQGRLDAALVQLGAAAEASDAAEGTARAGRAAALDAAQAAWAAWRQAECAAIRRDAEGGGGEAAAAAECAMRLTGARAVELEERLRRGEGP